MNGGVRASDSVMRAFELSGQAADDHVQNLSEEDQLQYFLLKSQMEEEEKKAKRSAEELELERAIKLSQDENFGGGSKELTEEEQLAKALKLSQAAAGKDLPIRYRIFNVGDA